MTKKKIAVLGGGVGAMTAAYYLTSFQGWKDQYELTVYQLGWRLGGKGASGRNREIADRIEEHGLHMFFGFYDNAFATMQAVYGELGRHPDAPLSSWDEAWKPHDYFVLEEIMKDGSVIPWPFDFPRNDGVPGVGGVLPTPWQMLEIVLGWMKELFEKTSAAPIHTSVTEQKLADTVTKAADHIGASDEVEGLARHVLHTIVDAITEGPQSLIPNTFLHAAHHHVKKLPDDPTQHSAHDHKLIVWLLRQFRTWLREHWREEAKIATEIRRALWMLDLGIAATVGMIVDELIIPPVNWFKIDSVRFEDWLMKHGALREATESPPVLLLSEVVFARWAGVGAGTCLHYALRLAITYKGAFAWKMQAGMGDTIFGPFYELLRRRGVKFEFFHAVEELGVADRNIETIRIGVQATVKGGKEYEPLYDVNGLPCWPSDPLFEQLVEGEELKKSGENLENWWTRWKNVASKTLQRGKDFDEVVLGIGIGAYPYIAKQLMADEKFARFVNEVVVTETQAAQLWMRPSFDGMGWQPGDQPVIGTYYEPFDTISDMTHLLPRESWPPLTVGSITYLTAQLPDPGPVPTPPRSDWQYPYGRLEKVNANLREWNGRYFGGLFPWATDSNDGAIDRALVVSEFSIGCWNPSDRYVLSVPGSVNARIPSAGTGYHNLVVANDATLTAVSSGCVEAAVMSGMHASRAMCGYPRQIVGDSLPDGGDVRPPAPPPPPAPTGRYVEIDGNNTPLQPYVAQNVTMYNFVLQADPAKLQAVIDQQLNVGGPRLYKPMGPFVAYVCATMGPMKPLEPKAWLDEKDFGFWVPVMGPRGPAFFVPYLWVDNYVPQQAGREVFGYPKGVGILKNPQNPHDPAEFTLDAHVVPEENGCWTEKRLVTAARRGGGEFGNLVREVETIAALGEAVLKELVKHGLPEPTWKQILGMIHDAIDLDVPMVFLKQFRDVADGRNACYQAIVEAPNQMPGLPIGGGFLHGDWELAIAEFYTVKIIEHLGLRVVDGKVPSAFHFWVQMAFTAQPGRVVRRIV